MPRIIGVDVPDNKRIIVGLTYIYGIGPTRAQEICKDLGLDENTRGKELSGEQVAKMASHIETKYVVEGQLRRQVAQDINRLKAIRCYRGTRHTVGLPVRGQRTRTNARTRKGPRKTVAGKKGVKEVR
jgi:small subunit ribosomal protein S13